ncbi:MAG: hypothetical protein KR126chlam1_01394 [Chlamydiae bacterium]|nr:hypothetical protein [Chlamydiota bacterium]
MKTKESPRYANFFRYWWTILLLLFCYGFYLHGMHTKKEMRLDLGGKVLFLESQLFCAIEKRDDLLLQMDSQSDPAWIEMLIKKNLGMVPKGQLKVYFHNE